MRVVQAFGRETARSPSGSARTNEDQYDANMETVRISAKYFPFVEFAGVVGTAVIVGLGGWLRRPGRRRRSAPSPRSCSTSTTCSSRSSSSASSTTPCSRPAPRCTRSSSVLDTAAVDRRAPGRGRPARATARSRSTHVTFAYGDQRAGAARRDAARSRRASGSRSSGPTGAGKSTLAKLIARFYDPREGAVRVRRRRPARRDDRVAARAHRRRAAGGLPVRGHAPRQRPGRPARGDRRRGRRRARGARPARALRRASPKGSTPRCASAARGCRRGSASSSRSRAPRSPTRRCSCSTRRRRTSTPAPSTRSSGRSSALMHGRTVVVVAHRLSTAARADRIAVVDDGGLAELGTHDELVAPRGPLRQPVCLVVGRVGQPGGLIPAPDPGSRRPPGPWVTLLGPRAGVMFADTGVIPRRVRGLRFQGGEP